MSKIYIITSILALSFFSYAQHRGMSVFSPGSSQQLAKTGGSGSSGWSRSSSLSHK